MTTACTRCGTNAYKIDWDTNSKACANCGQPVSLYTPNTRNGYDHRGSLEQGNQAEEEFKSLAERKGFIVAPASYNENAFDHFDFYLIKHNKRTRIEVKSRKRIDSWDASVQDEWIWIELHGVRQSDPGWLNGRADMIAFQQSDHFILVKLGELRELVKLLVMDKQVDRPSQALYKIYKRIGRHDTLTMIKAQDLLKINHWIWR